MLDFGTVYVRCATRWVNRWFSKCIVWITGTHLAVHYTPGNSAAMVRAHVDTSGGIYVANHTSALDPCLLDATIPTLGAHTWFKHDLFLQCPWIAYAAHALEHVAIQRGQTDIETFREVTRHFLSERARDLYGRQAYAVFPEGKRVWRDLELGEFRLGAFHVAKLTNACVIPVVLRDSARVCAPGQYVPTPGVTVHVLYGQPMYADPDETAMAFADRVRDTMRAMLN